MNAGFTPEHATFIWTAYGLSMVILIWTAVRPLLRERKLRRLLKAAQNREENMS